MVLKMSTKYTIQEIFLKYGEVYIEKKNYLLNNGKCLMQSENVLL